MSSKTIPKPKAASIYFGATPEETGWLLVKMADRMTRYDLVEIRTMQFLNSFPDAKKGEARAYWDAQVRSLGL